MEWESTRAMRPFWMHQIVEYIIGAVFISTGFASPTPVVPAVIGAIVMLNAAIADGPGGAFNLVHRRVHRLLDLVVLALVVVVCVQPVIEVDSSTRLLMALLGFVMGFVWWNTDFATKSERKKRRVKTAGPSADEVGKTAGKTAAEGYLAAKRLKKAMIDDRRDDSSST